SRPRRLARWARRKPVHALAALGALCAVGLFAAYTNQQLASERRQREQIANVADDLSQAEALAKERHFDKANEKLTSAQAGLNALESPPGDLRLRLERQQRVVGRSLAEQQRKADHASRLARFRQLTDDALFHQTLFTGLDRASSQARVRQAARDALALFGLDANLSPNEVADRLDAQRPDCSRKEHAALVAA